MTTLILYLNNINPSQHLTKPIRCVFQDKDKKRYKTSVNQLGLGDFKGASFSHEIIDIAESKSSLDQVRLDLSADGLQDVSSDQLIMDFKDQVVSMKIMFICFIALSP